MHAHRSRTKHAIFIMPLLCYKRKVTRKIVLKPVHIHMIIPKISSAICAAMLLLVGSAFGATYNDATNDLLPATASFTHCDITSVVVTNDATKIYFTIYVAGDPIAANWGQYNIG